MLLRSCIFAKSFGLCVCIVGRNSSCLGILSRYGRYYISAIDLSRVWKRTFENMKMSENGIEIEWKREDKIEFSEEMRTKRE